MGKLERRYLETADGRERRLAFPIHPERVRRTPPEALVRILMPTIAAACRAVRGRPDGQPELLSEREMRAIDPGAVLHHPARVWLTFRLVDAPDAGAGRFGETPGWFDPSSLGEL